MWENAILGAEAKRSAEINVTACEFYMRVDYDIDFWCGQSTASRAMPY
jgi:hypothetical protein